MRFPVKDNLQFPEDLECSPHVYYSNILGPLYRKKLKLLCDYLPEEKGGRILEIGFGAGIALKELSSRFEEVQGIDIHDNKAEVEVMLKKEHISNVELFKHDIFHSPFGNKESFDCVISSSVFEHIPKDQMLQGVQHVYDSLKKGGYLLIGFPLKSQAMNSLFKAYEMTYKRFKKDVYDFSLEDDHVSGEPEITSCVGSLFNIEQKKYFVNKFLRLYSVIKCRKEN